MEDDLFPSFSIEDYLREHEKEGMSISLAGVSTEGKLMLHYTPKYFSSPLLDNNLCSIIGCPDCAPVYGDDLDYAAEDENGL